MTPTISAVVVSFSDPDATDRAIVSLMGQDLPALEILVADNDPAGSWYHSNASTWPEAVRGLHFSRNLGYTNAVNRAANEARGDWLFIMNPDAVADADCLRRLLEGVTSADVTLVGAQVLLPDGRVNAGENPVNIAGVSWSGGYGDPREHAPARDVAAVSGAALMVHRETFLAIGGLCPFFFMYVDDTDLAWRIRLSGGRVRYCPEAVVVHDYEFVKGAHKWFYLERNRLWALASNLRPLTLGLLAPVLIPTELFMFCFATSSGWFAEAGKARLSLLRNLPALLRWRKSVQSLRVVSDCVILERFAGGFDSRLLDVRALRVINPCLEFYRSMVLRLLRLSGQ